MANSTPTRVKLIEAITTPLGFFVLALLIVEAFLATVVVGGNLDPAQKTLGMCLGVGLFLLVTVLVAVLVWFKPTDLTFNKEAHLADRRELKTVYSESSASSILLRKFWKPGGGKVDQQNQHKLLDWLNSNELGEIPLTAFIRAETFREHRAKAIADLGLGCTPESE